MEQSKKSSGLGKFGAATLIPIALASIFAISNIAYAHDEDGKCGHGHWDKDKRAEFFQKRQKELHDKLALTSSQEPAWNSFVAKIKPNEMHKKEDWKEISKLPTPERLDRFLARAKEREQRIETRVQATKDFYQQLTPAQQKTFDASFQHRGHHKDHDGEHEHS